MTEKKSKQKNIENKRSLFLLMGLVVVLGAVFIVFEWGRSEERVVNIRIANGITEIDLIEIPPTMPPRPPKPLNQTNTDIFKIVEHDPTTNLPEPTDKPVLPGIDYGQDTTGFSMPSGGFGGVVEPVDTIIDIPDLMPKFKGDLNKWLSKNIKYPQTAINNDIQGRVICQFVVGKDGSITDIVVVRSVDKSLDNEARRVITAMPKWQPGIQNGSPVKVRFTLPVQFTLEKK
jgi:TonB family C-terminal domain